MNTKVLLVAVSLSTLLFTCVAGTTLVHSGKANPQMSIPYYSGHVAPDWSTEPPTVLIFSPENNTVYGSSDVSLSFNVSVGYSKTASWCFLENIYYETDWQSNKTSVYENIRKPRITGYPSLKMTTSFFPSSKMLTEFSESINLTGIPDGNHTLMVYAVESGYYYLYSRVSRIDNRNTYHNYNSFRIAGSSLFRFSVDTTPPKVSILSLENETYYSPDIQLNFTVSEKPSLVSYSFDGQENVTITGNTTVTSLPYGEHSVTVYAADNAGNVGASETIYFSIEEPFPTMMVIASIAVVSVIASGLLFYFKKRKGGRL